MVRRTPRLARITDALTIAIATYNGAAYVGHAIASAVACGARVIVSDDGSTDGTVAIARSFGSNVRLLARERNTGIAANYQSLLYACETPLALFLNQDDLLYPRWLQSMPVRLGEVTVLNGWVIDDRGGRIRLIYRRPPFHASVRGVYPALLRTGFFKSPSQAIFPVALARAQGGFEIPDAQGQGAEDWMCWLRLAAAETPFRVRMWPRIAYRVHADNYSNQSASHLQSKAAVRRAFPAAPSRTRRLGVRL
jgi:glycosyltransferase involved in cell wall biosynthesis